MIYFDNAATTAPSPQVLDAFMKAQKEYGNPDSLHALGRRASNLVEKSRHNIASMLGVRDEEILFTSCGSESNSLATIGYALANRHRGNHIITSNVEHSSTQHAMEFLESLGFKITRLSVDENGRITPQALADAIDKDTILVSLIHVNNEMGAINDLSALSRVTHSMPKAVFHADCTQSFTKLDIPYEDLDLMTASAHKIHGLKGSALLLKKKNIQLAPLIQGGQQEQGIRGGTLNGPADIILARTVRLAMEDKDRAYENVSRIRQYLIDELSKIEGVHILSPEGSVPYILNIALDGITSEVLQNALDDRGIYISARSTCQSSQSGANPVLMAIGVDEKLASHAIRLSFSGDNTLEEAKTFVKELKEIIKNYGLNL